MANVLHLARVNSGNTGFRKADFANGVPATDAEKLRAVEYMNTRDEDTDGKYREGDFANGTPQTAAEKELSAKIDAMRVEMEKHYRATDFEGDKPKSEEEIMRQLLIFCAQRTKPPESLQRNNVKILLMS